MNETEKDVSNDKLKRRHARLLRWLKAISKYEIKEIVKDEFAYDRLLANVREAAMRAIKEDAEI